MKINELREKIRSFQKYTGTEIYPSAPVIHIGFPNCFNLSFAEYEFLQAFKGQYLKCDHDLIYSKIQPCIRHQDWETIKSDEKNRYRYLSLFEMADIGGFILLKQPDKQKEVAQWSIKSFIDFIRYVGLDIDKLRISYFEETNIKDATGGKYNIDRMIPTDPMMDYWERLGIKKEQLIPDKTRDTLLSLRIFGLPTPWGYRNEIHYEYRGELLDIGTVEYMKYEPLFNENGEIYDLKEYEHSLGISVIGIERLNMIINNLEYVWEVDSIKPLIDLVLLKAKNKDNIQAMILVQALRAINQIVVDGGVYSSLNKKRKEYIRLFYYSFFESSKMIEFELTKEHLIDLLNLNAELQENSKQFKDRINLTINEFLKRSEAFINDKSIKYRGVAQR